MPTRQTDANENPLLFGDDDSNSARLIELRDILANDPDLTSVSDPNGFRGELAALEAHAANKATAAAARQIAVVLENTAGCQIDRVILDLPDSEDPDETLNLAVHEAVGRWILSPGDVIRVSEGHPRLSAPSAWEMPIRTGTAPDVIGRLSIGVEACDENLGSICIANRGNGFSVFINGGVLPDGAPERSFPASVIRCLANAYAFAVSLAQHLIEHEVQVDSMISATKNTNSSDDTSGSPPAMTFEEFRATARNVEDLRQIDDYGESLDQETPGRVYQGPLCIERSVHPRTGWVLTLNGDECQSNDLTTLERKLYQFALTQEIISRPPIEGATRPRWAATLEAAITTLIEIGGYDVDIEHLRGALAEAKGES